MGAGSREGENDDKSNGDGDTSGVGWYDVEGVHCEGQGRISWQGPWPLVAKDIILTMSRCGFSRIKTWLLEIEMGVVWGVSATSLILFVFASIWFIDPALLTLILQFRQAVCTTADSAILVGISNCSWTSCRIGCTRDVYKCWQVQVKYDFVEGSTPYAPPWTSISEIHLRKETAARETTSNLAKLYPNVKGCGYPPVMNCETFFGEFGPKGTNFDCWVSSLDGEIAMTELNLDRAKSDVVFSLVPLLIFIVFTLYGFCRLGVFSVCNPLKCCPKAADTRLKLPVLTSKKLFSYKKDLVTSRKEQALNQFKDDDGRGGGGGSDDDDGSGDAVLPLSSNVGLSIPETIEENSDEKASTSPTPPRLKSSPSSRFSFSPVSGLAETPPRSSPTPPPSTLVSRNRNRVSVASPTFSLLSPTPSSGGGGGVFRSHPVGGGQFFAATGGGHQRSVTVSGGGNNSFIIQSGRTASRGSGLGGFTDTPSPTESRSESSTLQHRKLNKDRQLQQEVLDMSDFDFDLAALEDDAVSIRSMRTTLATAQHATSVGTSGAGGATSGGSIGTVAGWTRNEAVAPWSSSAYSGNRKKTK
jgi:hypothetical protein